MSNFSYIKDTRRETARREPFDRLRDLSRVPQSRVPSQNKLSINIEHITFPTPCT